MPDNHSSKARLRHELRALRRSIDTRQRTAASEAVAGHIQQLPGISGHQRFALYLPADGEVDTGPLITILRAQGKQLFLPVIREDKVLDFAPWNNGDELQPNRYGIPEPAGVEPGDTVALDVIFMPLVGWDQSGGRLGMGGGFYDRSLQGVNGPLLVGLAYTVQECAVLPLEAWDVCLDFVATETALLRCQDNK